MKRTKLVIPGILPNLNDYIAAERQHRQKAAAMKRQCEQVVMLAAKGQLRRMRFTGPVVMRYTWYEPNRRRDKDNVSSFGRKVIQDALVKAGILPNDGWANIEGFSDRFEVDKKNPRVEVEIDEDTSADAGGYETAGGRGAGLESPGKGGGPG